MKLVRVIDLPFETIESNTPSNVTTRTAYNTRNKALHHLFYDQVTLSSVTLLLHPSSVTNKYLCLFVSIHECPFLFFHDNP